MYLLIDLLLCYVQDLYALSLLLYVLTINDCCVVNKYFIVISLSVCLYIFLSKFL